MIEQILNAHLKVMPGFRAICLRYFNPVGANPSGLIGHCPVDLPDSLLSNIVKVANGQLPHLCIYGNNYNTVDGTGVRDYIHVTDIARGHIAARDKCSSGLNIFNIGTGKGTSVLQLINAFEKISGVKIKTIVTEKRQTDAETSLAITDKASQLLNFRSQLSLEDACRDTWRWAKRNPNGYQ